MKTRYKSIIGFFLVILLIVENFAYAMDKGELDTPLLISDQRSSSAVRMSSSSPDIEMKLMDHEGLPLSDDSQKAQSPSPRLKTFLETHHLKRSDLEARDLSLERLQELLQIDTTWRTSFRWMAVDASLEKILYYSVLKRNSITYFDNELKGKCCDKKVWINGRDLPILSKSTRQNLLFMEGLGNGMGYVFFRELHLAVVGFLWYDVVSSIQNGNLSFNAFVNVFRYQETATINYLLGFFQNQAGPYIVGGILGAPFLWGITKGLWNVYAEKNSTLQNRMVLQEEIRSYPTGFWADGVRWLLPFHPLDWRLNMLIKALRFNGRITAQEIKTISESFEKYPGLNIPRTSDNRSTISEEGKSQGLSLHSLGTISEIFETLKQVAIERKGYSPIVGMDHLANLAYGINFRDYGKLVKDIDHITEEERQKLLTYLQVKLESYSLIHYLSEDLIKKWKKRENFTQGADLIWKGLYAKYLMWSLGQNNWGWLTMGSLKVAKVALFGFFLKTLISSLIQYFYCPNEFKALRYGEIGPISDTIECFGEYVRIFNQVPGQPAETLTSLIPHVNFPENQYVLDLSNHGIGNTSKIVEILGAFYQNGIRLNSINLSGNLGQSTSPQDYRSLVEAIFQHENLQTLNLSSNWIDYIGTHGTISIGEGLQHLPNLTALDLSNNHIGHTGTNGTIAIGEGLQYVPNLTTLDLSTNWIGYIGDEGTIAIGEGLQHLPNLTTLDLSHNGIGYIGTNGTVAIGEGLQYVPNLTTLDLSFNNIGYIGDEGTIAIGEGLQHLPNLTTLGLSVNWIGGKGDLGIQVIGEGLLGTRNLTTFKFLPQGSTITPSMVTLLNEGLQKTKAGLLPFGLMTLEDVQNYLADLPQNTTEINLSDNLNNRSPVIVTALFQGLRPLNITVLNLNNIALYPNEIIAVGEGLQYVPNLTTLDLSNIYIGYRGTNGTTAIGEGLQHLPKLTTLNLSGNYIGHTGTNGTIALAKGLRHLPNLTTLDLSINNIGSTLEVGTIAIGESLQYLPNLITLDLSVNNISFTGEAGIVAIGEGLQYLPNLTTLDLSGNRIGSMGEAGTRRIGEGLQNNKVLKNLYLGGNDLGQHGSVGLEVLLNAVVREGLNLDLAGAINIPWTTGVQALYTLNAGPIQTACYQQRCFGGNLPQNGATSQNIGTRRLLSLEEYDPQQDSLSSDSHWGIFSPGQRRTLSAAFGERGIKAVYKGLALEVEEDENLTTPNSLTQEELQKAAEIEKSPDPQPQQKAERILDVFESLSVEQEPTPFFLTRWSSGVGRLVAKLSRSTKETVHSYWNSFGDWLTDTITDYAHEVVTQNPSYFPNGNNPNVRDWPSGSIYVNATSLHGGGIPALPPGVHFAALP